MIGMASKMCEAFTESAISKRQYWVQEIRQLSGNFRDDYRRLEEELTSEVNTSGIDGLVSHIRLCGSIPESYAHDSSEEKLYSKYTDCLLSLAFTSLGFTSLVLSERSASADVEVCGPDYCFVADAKAFRLSRTAKNQKDFKVAAMNTWKRGKPKAMVVCPIYQLPRSSSQIYGQATSLDVCLFTYSHLSVLLCYSLQQGVQSAQQLLSNIFEVIPSLNASNSSTEYWRAINRSMIDFSPEVIRPLWQLEKIASMASIEIAKESDLTFLAQQREKIMRLSHTEAVRELIAIQRIDSRESTINSVRDNNLFGVE